MEKISNKSCLSCNLSDLEVIYDFGLLPLVNSYFNKEDINKEEKFPLELFYCKHCWLVQLGYFPDPKKMYNEYHHISGASKGNVKHLRDVSEYINRISGSKKSILEIGSNDNTLIEMLKDLEFDCLAIDPAKNINKNMEDTISEFFNLELAQKLKSQGKKFDIILGLNVFAHNDTFIDMFKGCEILLNEDGFLIIEVAYALETIFSGNFDTIYHEHVCSYSLTSIENALNSVGLYVFDAEEIDTQGGSIRVVARKARVQDKTKSYLGIKEKEEQQKITSKKFYDNISNEIDRKITNINKLFEASELEKFLILGSPARGVVTLNVSNRKINMESVILDDTPEKQNKLMPGIHIPVKSWDQINFQDFQNALVLSWNYKDDMIKRLKDKKFKGDVYTPFPELIKEKII